MKTSLNELQLIERQLFGTLDRGDQLLFEAKMVLGPELKQSMLWQRKTYQLVRQFGRMQLKKEIEQVHDDLFRTSAHLSFRQKIFWLFKK